MVNERKTTPISRFAQSMKSGLSAISTGNNTYYILEHKGGSNTYHAGTSKEIIVDYIELGRNPDCTIPFNESDGTVSRKHAAIQKEGGAYKLIQLSETNQTILNGRPVKESWYLKSGDEFQLANGGPKLSFIVPQNNKTKSIQLSRRLDLFREQALRPYRKALTAITSLFVVVTIASGFFIWKINKDHDETKKELIVTIESLEKQKGELKEQKSIAKDNAERLQLQRQQDSITDLMRQEQIKNLETVNKKILADIKKRNEQYKNDSLRAIAYIDSLFEGGLEMINLIKKVPFDSLKNALPLKQKGEISKTFPGIYFIQLNKVIIYYANGEELELEMGYSGTAFVTDDGNLVTARHVIEPWNFPSNDPDYLENLIDLNIIATNDIGSIVSELTLSNSYHESFTVLSNQFSYNSDKDEFVEIETDDGAKIIRAANNNPNDIAYYNVGTFEDALKSNKESSLNLKPGAELFIAGYPWGLGKSSNPIASKTTVGGYDSEFIIVNPSAFDHGNSGGPAFILNNNQFEVIGVVSNYIGSSTGRIVPISKLSD